MKKLISMALAAGMAVSLAACGGAGLAAPSAGFGAFGAGSPPPGPGRTGPGHNPGQGQNDLRVTPLRAVEITHAHGEHIWT